MSTDKIRIIIQFRRKRIFILGTNHITVEIGFISIRRSVSQFVLPDCDRRKVFGSENSKRITDIGTQDTDTQELLCQITQLLEQLVANF